MPMISIYLLLDYSCISGSCSSICLMRMAVRGMGSATVSPTTSLFLRNVIYDAHHFRHFHSAGYNAYCRDNFCRVEHIHVKMDDDFGCVARIQPLRISSLFSFVSSGVRCLMPYCFCLSFISSLSQSRSPTNRIFDGLI